MLNQTMQPGIPPLDLEDGEIPISFKRDGVHGLRLKGKQGIIPYGDIKSIEVHKEYFQIIPRKLNSDKTSDYSPAQYNFSPDDDRFYTFWMDLRVDFLRWAMQSGAIGKVGDVPVYRMHIPDINFHVPMPKKVHKALPVNRSKSLTSNGRLYASHEEFAAQELNKGV